MIHTDIIIIRGAPGSGKTQVAKSLSVFYPKGIRMEIDTIRNMVISVDWVDQQEHINMLDTSIRLIAGFLQFHYRPIMVIDTFSGDKINRFIENLYADNKNLIVAIFGLFTTYTELKKRLSLRAANDFRDFAVSQKINEDTQRLKYANEFQIDTTGLQPENVASQIKNILSKEQKRI